MTKNKKIAIIGAGNAGCITALALYKKFAMDGLNYFTVSPPKIEITIYHDPSIPKEIVGLGTTLDVPEMLSQVLGIDWYEANNAIKATPKTGILYENWGKKNEKIFHPFALPSQSIHFVPDLLSKSVLQCGLFNVIEKNITDPEKEIDADFIFDCRGKNNRDPELYETLINPLNHVILARKPEPDLKLNYTRTVATPDGWTFVIPNHDSVSYGYLFNDKITDVKDASSNFIEMFDVNPSENFAFENYSAKSFTQGERTILNGNRAFFLEPLEATSMAYYHAVVELFLRNILLNQDKDAFNAEIKFGMREVQTFVMWHYQSGSKYDTAFWSYAKSLPFNPDAKFKKLAEYAKKNNDITCRLSAQALTYAQWNINSFKNWENGTN